MCSKHMWTSGPRTCYCLPIRPLAFFMSAHPQHVCDKWGDGLQVRVCVVVCPCRGYACQGSEHHHQGLFPSACDVRTEISGSTRSHSPMCQATAPGPNKIEIMVTLFMCKQRRLVEFWRECTHRENNKDMKDNRQSHSKKMLSKSEFLMFSIACF